METTVKNNENMNMTEKKISMEFGIEVPETIEKFGGAKITVKVDALYKASEQCLKAEQEFREKMLGKIFQMAKEIAGEEETDKKRNYRYRRFKK